MNTKLKAVIVGGAMLAGLSGTAAARPDVNFSLSLGVPAYAPYYVAPAPVYYGPPAPVYYAPRPRVYYAPVRAYYGPRYYYGHRHHHHRHWR